MSEEGNLITIGIEEPQEANSSREEDNSLEEDNSQEDVFDRVVMIIAEAKEKIRGTDEERKERERINEEVFQKNIFCRLKDASLWFQFHLSFDKKKDFSKLERLSGREKLKTLKFWKYWLFSSLEGLEKDKRNYHKATRKWAIVPYLSKNFAQYKKRMFTHLIINGASKINTPASVLHIMT